MKKRQFTPETISALKENEIFVFGSNMNGNHAGGAAKTAVEKFGAIDGKAEGIQGQSYAIPTLTESMEKRSLDDIRSSLETFIVYAEEHSRQMFYVTKIGCGIAGFSIAEISSLFKGLNFPLNVILPIEFCATRGYKVFNSDWTCRDHQYKVGETYTMEGEVEICRSGYHFCEKLVDCYDYYKYSPKNKVAEVEMLGYTHTDDGKKFATNAIRIVREIKWEDVSAMVNAGYCNSGYRNSGDCNSGYRNSGVFCNRKYDDKIVFFNKESDMTWGEWYSHPVYSRVQKLKITKWIDWVDMTDQERKALPKAYVCRGYLKEFQYKEAWKKLWESLSEEEKESFKTLPNYDADVFEDITGIRFE